jgi:hypothetical protein
MSHEPVDAPRNGGRLPARLPRQPREEHPVSSRQFTVNNLNRDFVGTRGFSVVFVREQVAEGRRASSRSSRPTCSARCAPTATRST